MPPKRKATASVEGVRTRSRGLMSSTTTMASTRKSIKLPRLDPDQPDCVIRWEIENVPGISDSGQNSPIHVVKGLHWYVRARTESSERTNNSTHLSLYLYCDEKNSSEVWYADALATFTLMNRDLTKNLKEKFSYRFCAGQSNSGYASLIPRQKLINAAEGFITTTNKATVEVALKVVASRGLREQPILRDFTQPQPHMTDGALVVQGKKLHISKQYLALHSPVFEALFFHGFKESTQKEIELEDIEYEDFLELLHVLYPSSKAVTASTVAKLLRLADQFQLKAVLRQAEAFLSTTTDLQWSSKLKLADQYNLFDAQNAVMQSLKYPKDFELLKTQKDYLMLSDTLKLLITEKQLKVMIKQQQQPAASS